MLIKAPHRRTPAQIERDNQRLRDKALEVYELLNTADVQKSCKAVYGAKTAGDGVTMRLSVYPDEDVYIHARPWSRGYAVHVSDSPEADAINWRGAPDKYKGLQRAIYSPRGTVGAWRIPAREIADVMLEYADTLERWSRAKHVRAWPKMMAHKFCQLWPDHVWGTDTSLSSVPGYFDVEE